MANYSSRKRKRSCSNQQYAKRARYGRSRRGYSSYRRVNRNIPTLGKNIVKSTHVYSSDFGASTTSRTTNLAYSFNANAFPGVANLLKTFDAYRITRIDCEITNLTPGKRLAHGYWPTVYMCSDENDSNVAPTLLWIQAKSTTKTAVLTEGKSIKISFVPTVENRTGIVGQYTMHRNVWIDANSSKVEHNGLKFVVTNFESKDLPNMQLKCKAHIY